MLVTKGEAMRRFLLLTAFCLTASITQADVVVEKVSETEFKIVEGNQEVIYSVTSAEEKIDELKRERQQIISQKNTAIARVSGKFEGSIIAYTGEINVIEEAKQKAIDELNLANGY